MSAVSSKSFLAAAALLFGGAAAQAAICTATSSYTNPDATVTNSTSCGVGILNDNNDEAADLNTLLVGGFNSWASIAKVEAKASSNNGLTTTGTNPAGSSGSWSFDDLLAYDTYALVIKDGGAPGGSEDSIYWAWFVVDTSSGCDSLSALSGKDYCGLWSMYGDNGKIKEISHIQLYGVNSSGGGTTGGGTTGGGTTGGGTTGGGSTGGGNIPEPGSIGLVGLGLGLLCAGFMSRRRRQAQAEAV